MPQLAAVRQAVAVGIAVGIGDIASKAIRTLPAIRQPVVITIGRGRSARLHRDVQDQHH